MAKRKFGIAVDIGTTTIEAALISENGEIARTSFCPNAGARFGADVMSRIRAASEGHGEELSALLKQDITEAIRKLLAEVYDADGGVSVTYTGGPETDGADTQGPPPMAEPASCTAIKQKDTAATVRRSATNIPAHTAVLSIRTDIGYAPKQ